MKNQEKELFEREKKGESIDLPYWFFQEDNDYYDISMEIHKPKIFDRNGTPCINTFSFSGFKFENQIRNSKKKFMKK